MSELAEQVEDQPKIGRPLLFQSVEELDQKINEYFESRSPHVVKVMVKKLNESPRRVRRLDVDRALCYLTNTQGAIKKSFEFHRRHISAVFIQASVVEPI